MSLLSALQNIQSPYLFVKLRLGGENFQLTVDSGEGEVINDQQKDQSMFCIIRCVMLCSYLLAHCNVFPTFTTHPLCGTHPAWQSLSRIIHLSITKQYHCAVQIHYTLYNHNNHIYRTLFISLFPRKQLVFNTLIYQEHGAVDSSNRRNIITPCQNILLPSDYRHSKADGESEVASSLCPLNSCRYCHQCHGNRDTY